VGPLDRPGGPVTVTMNINAMVAEVLAIGRRVEADQRVGALMYKLGHADGFAAGYRCGERDDSALWCWALGLVQKCALMLTHKEMVRRRAEDPIAPCPVKCGRCSRCVRAHAWQANGHDYPGDGGR